MAKGKSSNAAKTGAPATSKRKSPASSNGRSTSKKPVLKTPRSISNEAIGHAAGELWSVLSQDSGQTLAAIKKSIDAPPELILAALGWLAREDKLEFATNGRTVKISLR